jgi:cytochrome c biogenesis protein
MLPVDLDGWPVFLSGVRSQPDEPMRYLRLPADEQSSLEGFSTLAQALAQPALLEEAVNRYVHSASPVDKPEITEPLKTTARRTLALFSGLEKIEASPDTPEPPLGGLPALEAFMKANVPPQDREKISEVLLRVLNGCLLELYQITRTQRQLQQAPANEDTRRFLTQALISLSDSFAYPSGFVLVPSHFEQVQASIFQVARAPGKTVVYLGAVLLILGVFAMLYLRDRRLWVWVAPAQTDLDASPSLVLKLAYAPERKTLGADAEFNQLKQMLLPAPALPSSGQDTPAAPTLST